MKLTEAINLYKYEKGASSNSYDWYRKSAKSHWCISIGKIDVSAYKKRGTWYVDKIKFFKAIAHHRGKIKQIKQNTDDYTQGIIYGSDGDIIETEWGGYRIYKNFRYVWYYYLKLRQKSDGTWYCNACNNIAETKYDKEECHLCRDWNGCGENCTLSEVFCTKCQAKISWVSHE